MKRFLLCVADGRDPPSPRAAGIPKVKAQRYVAAGDAYVAQHKFKEAILEYRNALAGAAVARRRPLQARARVHGDRRSRQGVRVRTHRRRISTRRISTRSCSRASCC